MDTKWPLFENIYLYLNNLVCPDSWRKYVMHISADGCISLIDSYIHNNVMISHYAPVSRLVILCDCSTKVFTQIK